MRSARPNIISIDENERFAQYAEFTNWQRVTLPHTHSHHHYSPRLKTPTNPAVSLARMVYLGAGFSLVCLLGLWWLLR